MEEKQSSSVTGADFEALSALMDDEASEFEIHRALKLLDESPEARDHWIRYQRISEGCKGELFATGVDVNTDLSGAVRDRLADEPVYSASGAVVTMKTSGFNRFFGRAAIAASVAVSVVVGSQFWGVDVSQERFQEPTVVDVGAPAGFNIPVSARMASAGDTSYTPAAQSAFPGSKGSQRVIVLPSGVDRVEVERRLNWLLLQHAEHAAANSVGMMPYARISKLPVRGVDVSREGQAED